jgi:hypothetical protein
MTGKDIRSYLLQEEVALNDWLAVTVRLSKGLTGLVIGRLVGSDGNRAIRVRYNSRVEEIPFNKVERIDKEVK